jgi:hypothetical protein
VTLGRNQKSKGSIGRLVSLRLCLFECLAMIIPTRPGIFELRQTYKGGWLLDHDLPALSLFSYSLNDGRNRFVLARFRVRLVGIVPRTRGPREQPLIIMSKHIARSSSGP